MALMWNSNMHQRRTRWLMACLRAASLSPTGSPVSPSCGAGRCALCREAREAAADAYRGEPRAEPGWEDGLTVAALGAAGGRDSSSLRGVIMGGTWGGGEQAAVNAGR